MQPLHHATQHKSKELDVLGLRWVPCRVAYGAREIVVVEGGQNDALHDALAAGKMTFTMQELNALQIVPPLTDDCYIRVGAGKGVHAAYYTPQTPIACLLESYRSQCPLKDENGMLPLHYAAKNGASELVIRKLLEACPQGATIRSFSERLPLHWGAAGRLSAGALKLLVEAFPEAVAMQDAMGYLPRDLAARGVQSLLV